MDKTEFINFLAKHMQSNKQDTNAEYIYGIDSVRMSDIISGGKLKRSPQVCVHAYILARIFKLIFSKNMELAVFENGHVGVWVNHKEFSEKLKQMDISKRTFERYIATLKNDYGVIEGVRKQGNYSPRMFYFLTERGLTLLSGELLGKYIGFLKESRKKKVIISENDRKKSGVDDKSAGNHVDKSAGNHVDKSGRVR
jgi:hypothetical protein